MSVVRDIMATYRRPGRVVARRLAMGQREDRALATLMAGCFVVFIAQWPRLARQAHFQGEELNMLLGSTLLAWVFIMPLFLYVMAFVVHIVLRAFGGRGSSYGSRLALFWALLASTPVMLFWGLVAGFIGASPILSIVGIGWLLLFAWFWLAALRAVHWPNEEAAKA
jgi:hypothetical protein